MSEFQYMQSMSTIIFTATTVLIGLSLVMIQSNWKLLKKAFDTLPPGKPRVIWQFGDIKDKGLYNKYESILMVYLGIIFFGLSIFTSLGSMICVFTQMLDIASADPTTDFKVGKYFFAASILLFFFGMVGIGIAHSLELLALKNGKPSILTGRLESLTSQMPTSETDQSDKS